LIVFLVKRQIAAVYYHLIAYFRLKYLLACFQCFRGKNTHLFLYAKLDFGIEAVFGVFKSNINLETYDQD